jgi:hypothetical protein
MKGKDTMLENNNLIFGKEYDKESFSIVDEGEYEVVINNAEIRKTKTEKEYLSVDYVIRKDVDQEFKGKHVFESIWRDKNNPEIFDYTKLNKIICTQPEAKLEFGSIEEVIQYLNGLKLIIYIETTFDVYSNSERNAVKRYSYKPTQYPEEQTITQNTSRIEVASDDLPF